MARRQVNPNAFKALEELKMEIGNELSVEDNFQRNLGGKKVRPGTIGGMATRNLVQMGQKKLIDKE